MQLLCVDIERQTSVATGFLDSRKERPMNGIIDDRLGLGEETRRRDGETKNAKKNKRNPPRPFYFGVSFSRQSPRRLAASGPQWRKGMEENSGDGRVAELDGGGFSDVNPPSRTRSTSSLTLGFR